jgi:hypothetical protein
MSLFYSLFTLLILSFINSVHSFQYRSIARSSIIQRHLAPTDVIDAYNNALVSSPLLTKSITAGVILGLADLTGQKLEGQPVADPSLGVVDKSLDAARILRFVVLGLALQAPWNHFYYMLLDGAIPPTLDPLSQTNLGKVFIDQFIQAPIFTAIIFLYLGLAEGNSMNTIIEDKFKKSYWSTLLDNWKLWVPATAVNIAFFDPIYRVLYLNCVFYFWSIYLSLKLNSNTATSPEDVQKE